MVSSDPMIRAESGKPQNFTLVTELRPVPTIVTIVPGVAEAGKKVVMDWAETTLTSRSRQLNERIITLKRLRIG
jgi:hypothetical protein